MQHDHFIFPELKDAETRWIGKLPAAEYFASCFKHPSPLLKWIRFLIYFRSRYTVLDLKIQRETFYLLFLIDIALYFVLWAAW